MNHPSTTLWNRAQVGLALFGIFALGAVAGGAFEHVRVTRERHGVGATDGSRRAHVRLEALRRRLALTSEQVARIEPLLVEADRRREAAAAPCRAELNREREALERRLEEELTPEQRARFRELLERRRRRGER